MNATVDATIKKAIDFLLVDKPAPNGIQRGNKTELYLGSDTIAPTIRSHT
jgi:hypothetical protein